MKLTIVFVLLAMLPVGAGSSAYQCNTQKPCATEYQKATQQISHYFHCLHDLQVKDSTIAAINYVIEHESRARH